MRAFLFTLTLLLALGSTVLGRDFADAGSATAALQFLKSARAVSICDGDMFFDGGSLSFTFTTEDGRKAVFVLSAQNQRKVGKRFLSIYQKQQILLVPDSFYDESVNLLREKLEAGFACRLQQTWPEFKEEAKELCQLLKVGGRPHDLDELYAKRALRMKKTHEAVLKNKEYSSNRDLPNQSAQPTPPKGG